MRREDVGAILRDVLESAERAEVEPGDMSFRVEGDYLAALCRLWLAVEDAPCAVAGQSPGRFYYVGGSAPVEHGQRVRIVPEQGEG